jgi:hypothetical protein
MSERITANLPAIDFDATAEFYMKLGFEVDFKDTGWMILSRGALEIEFFPYPDLNPWGVIVQRLRAGFRRRCAASGMDQDRPPGRGNSASDRAMG